MTVPDDVTLLWTDDKYVTPQPETKLHSDDLTAGATFAAFLSSLSVIAQVVLVFTTMYVVILRSVIVLNLCSLV